MESPPNQTLYINNINEKIQKEVLKKQLYMLFSQYGKVKQITACKGLKMRGQAWVVYHDLNSSIAAMKGKQSFIFYDKPLRIAYAKAQSNVVARLEAKGAGAGKKKRGREQLEAQAPASEAGPKAKEARIVNSVPNKILFAQNLPAEVTHAMLNAVFATAPGFVEVRTAGSKGVAFIEFENETSAGMALRQLDGYQLTPMYTVQLTYSN
ncbi:U2 small nuclear ribonucleoprotein B [Ochromonadaceae sp. CCMP2298]|nr:U2 small nuclear ribonucleoprotein B [Ochromonadaceae sp. CCMP2298]|mmetsp:Transcript_21988/g.48867  ORF Transcript_21988/g.48867 Transcript_21988/m.48867 type:complete len:209 (+) Transcript_21988:102-728(+)